MSLFDQGMNRLMAATWWMVLLRGLAAIAAGLLLVFQSSISLLVIALFFGGYLLASGVFAAVGAILNRRSHPRWWLDVLIGLLGVLVGIVVLANPNKSLQLAPELIIYILAGVVLLSGVLEIVKGLELRRLGHPDSSDIVVGVLYIISAVCLLLVPNMAIGIMFFAFAFLLLFIGGVLVYYAFVLRQPAAA
ncbi:MAG: DUF308 domain-containing protein [Chloroflexi bacterium]|nr:DUF308 domain-containing protein [Chloroflexota bacterium]